MVQQISYGQCVVTCVIFFHPFFELSGGSRRLIIFEKILEQKYIFKVIW